MHAGEGVAGYSVYYSNGICPRVTCPSPAGVFLFPSWLIWYHVVIKGEKEKDASLLFFSAHHFFLKKIHLFKKTSMLNPAIRRKLMALEVSSRAV